MLQNLGWFINKLAYYYSTDDGVTWQESGHTNAIYQPKWGNATLGELGVPYGALVKIHPIVLGGNDRTGSEVFQYTYNPYDIYTHHIVYYKISGTTLNALSWNFYNIIVAGRSEKVRTGVNHRAVGA